jgi:hypothetical protein
MNKRAFCLSIIGIALALVFVNGADYSARADCGLSFGCLPPIGLPSFSLCCPASNSGDKDKAQRDMDYSRGGVGRDLSAYNNQNVDEFGDDLATNSFNGNPDPDPKIRDMPYKFQPASEEKGLYSHKRF